MIPELPQTRGGKKSAYLQPVDSTMSLHPNAISTSAADRIRLTAVMPCLNEERTVAICIEKAFEAFRTMGIVGEVIVADNGSTDRSVELASTFGARVVHVAKKGYGAALVAGIGAARGNYVIMADSDDSYDWLGLAPFIAALDDGNDLVVGNRFSGGIDPGAMPRLHRYLGNPVLSWLARTVHGAPVGDFHCGMRAFRRDAFPRMNIRTSGMEFATEMIVNSAKAGLRIAEVPTRLRRDGRDRPPHLRSFRDGWRHLRFILTYGPNYLYVAPGGACLVIGLAMVAVLVRGPIVVSGHYFGIHFLALACALTLVGFNIVNYGILAKVVGLRHSSVIKSRVARWAMSSFSLEGTLMVGASLVLLGLGCDVWLLFKWLGATGAQMDSTVHAVFAASLAIVMGVNLSLGAFLLHMLVSEAKP
jgi:glycosyltransferase involved in cell wall biosynthesis